MNLTETTVAQKTVFKGRIINLRVDTACLPDGKTATREVIEHPGGVCVVPITEDNQIWLVRQFRYPYGEVIWEIPAGKLTPGEDPLECGKRELAEETGASAAQYTFLGELYPSPGYCAECIYMYAARGLTLGEMHPDEDEFIETQKFPLKTVIDWIIDGTIKDAKTQAAVMKVYIQSQL